MALRRHCSHAQSNGRVRENHCALGFSYGYRAPWNLCCPHPAALERLELAVRYPGRGFTKTHVVRAEGIDAQPGQQQASDGRMLVERTLLLLRATDAVRLDYDRCPARGISDRILDAVTRWGSIGRGGRRLLTPGLGQPISATWRPTPEADGLIPNKHVFGPAPLCFSRTGYEMLLGTAARPRYDKMRRKA